MAASNLNPKEEHVYPMVQRGVFRIDDDGSIWRVGVQYGDRANGKVYQCDPRCAERLMPHGYLVVRVVRYGTPIHVVAHRLVWRHFRGPIPEGQIINHLNGVKHDNRPDNLELTDHVGNLRHAREFLGWNPRGEGCGNAVLNDDLVRQIRQASLDGLHLGQLVEKFRHSRSNIHRVITWQTWKHVT